MHRRHLLAAAFAAAAPLAQAQAFPLSGKAIRMIVGYSAGGPTDTQARALAQAMGQALGTTVIIDNKPGATGMIGALEVMRAAPDGYTLLYTIDGPMTQNPHTLKVQYDVFKDFTPIARAIVGGVVLTVHPSLPVRNAKELVAYARAHPGKLSYGSFGTGSVSHIYGEVLAQNQGIDLVHVPYKGSSDALKDLLAGRIQLIFDSPATSAPFVKDGKLRVLAVAGEKRRALMPDVPTLLEEGLPGFELRSWNGVFGPARMQADVLARLRAAVVQARTSPAFRDVIRTMASDAPDETPEAFAGVVRSDYDRWGGYIRKLGIAVQ